MPLNDYIKKRDFKHTPEPKNSLKTQPSKELHFVVQKHHASHLHYDFRLEHDGVLKSWAIPKGFSLNPADKRLAMHVEDHPYDYKDFEGVIPEGNYGAGNVIIWDEGTYRMTPGHHDFKQGYEKGKLSFILNGKKLKGEFALIHFKKEDNAWLLKKHKDEYAAETFSFDETSVRSGRDVEDINQRTQVANKKTISDSDLNDAPEKPFPQFIKPMLASLVDAPFDSKDWIFEVKWDGYRTLAYISKDKISLYSRNNILQNDRFQEIASALSGGNENMVLDGEIVVVVNGQINFQMLQNYQNNPQGELIYYVFDILYYGTKDLTTLPLMKRKSILENVLRVSKNVRLSDYVKEQGKDFFNVIEAHGLEGLIAKKIDSTYQEGARTDEWLKIKTEKRQEAVICGFTDPRAGRNKFGSLILGIYKNEKLTFAGQVGTGFDDRLLSDLYERLQSLIIKECPFDKKPKTNMPATWVKPVLLCEVKFREWTDEGSMRQPVFMGIREDKSAKEVSIEHPQLTKNVLKKDKRIAPVSIPTKAELTNLDKIFWPDEGLTKGDVIEYYWKVARWMLPYLKNRPQSLRRNPNGIQKDSFFHKDIESVPEDWIKTFKIPSDSQDKEINYLLCQNKDTLIYMANLGCIEINVWDSSIQHLKNPDYIVIDLDPVETNFQNVVKSAIVTKKILDELELPSFCKTAGSRGIHIYVPLKPVFEYEHIRNFAKLINVALTRQYPQIFSTDKIQGFVHIDYPQNRYGSTMAAPYSLRPKAGAPVSTPLKWDEVKEGLDFLEFNIFTIPERLKHQGDVWKGFFQAKIGKERFENALMKIEQILR